MRRFYAILSIGLVWLVPVVTAGAGFTHTTDTISLGRELPAATSAGTCAFFAGGMTPYSTRVDIYDTGTNSWSTAELSQDRVGLGATASGT